MNVCLLTLRTLCSPLCEVVPGFVDSGRFVFEEFTMSKSRGAYAPEFRRQMVELVRAGRTPEELAHELEPTVQSIWNRNWVLQSERSGKPGGCSSLTTAEREELNRLRLEREICLVRSGD